MLKMFRGCCSLQHSWRLAADGMLATRGLSNTPKAARAAPEAFRRPAFSDSFSFIFDRPYYRHYIRAFPSKILEPYLLYGLQQHP
jgi:hypothetical protein